MTLSQPSFKAAVIGLGFIGAGDQVSGDAIGQLVGDLDGTHAQALVNHPAIRLVTGSSREEGRRKRFAEREQIGKTYADWREMLAVEKLDLVCVATNSPFHAEITSACAEAGVRAVLCEKPVATSLAAADRAIRLCRQHGTILAVNHNRRWHPLWRAVRDEIRQGAIGDVYQAHAHWSGGRLGNVGTHIFDALRMVLGAEPLAVSGTLDPEVGPDCRGAQFRDPGGWGVVAFSRGIKAFIYAPQTANLSFGVRLTGSLGQLSIYGYGDRASVELWDGTTRIISVAKEKSTSLDRAIQDVVECLTHGGQPASTGEDGLAALEIIIGFHVSDRLGGQWVPLPIADADRNLEVLIG